MLVWMVSAFAQSEAPSEGDPQAPSAEEASQTIEIAPAADLPSALDGLDQAHAEVKIAPVLGDWVAMPGNLVRGRPIVRPLLAMAVHERRMALRVGGALGHQWWTLTEGALQLGGESRLEITAPVGGSSGYRVELGTRAGPWLGPIGLRVGPLLRADRERWGEALLSRALLLGVGLDLSLLLGPLALTAGVEPAWSLLGDRAPAASGPLPGLGAEAAWRAGLGTTGKPAQLSLELIDRQTALGPIVETALTLRIRAF